MKAAQYICLLVLSQNGPWLVSLKTCEGKFLVCFLSVKTVPSYPSLSLVSLSRRHHVLFTLLRSIHSPNEEIGQRFPLALGWLSGDSQGTYPQNLTCVYISIYIYDISTVYYRHIILCAFLLFHRVSVSFFGCFDWELADDGPWWFCKAQYQTMTKQFLAWTILRDSWSDSFKNISTNEHEITSLTRRFW